MNRLSQKFLNARVLLAALPVLCAENSARGYVDLAPTFTKIVSDATNITLV